MSANAIWFEEKDNRFYFDGCAVRTEKLGRMLANALVRGEKFIEYAEVAVSVEYVRQMLDFVGKNGWFWDCLDHTAEHRFNNKQITPGCNWADAQELFGQAREGFRLAADLRSQGGRRNRELARLEELEARDLQTAAYERLMPGISQRPRRRSR